MPTRRSIVAAAPAHIVMAGWLTATVVLFALAEVVAARQLPHADGAAAAAIALRVAALLATLAGVAGFARKLQDGLDRRRRLADSERAHEARSALAAIEHAARALPPAASPLPLGDAIVSEVAVIRRLIDGHRHQDGRYGVAEALLGPVTTARLAGTAVDAALTDDLEAHGDPAALGQIVQALLDNARRHAPGATVTLTAERAAGTVAITVADDGPGVRHDLAERMFEAGVRSPSGGGTGLGLAAAASVAADQGGTLELLPTGPGAAFRVTIPAADAAVLTG